VPCRAKGDDFAAGYSFSVYIGSAIYTASIPYVTEKFHVSTVTATLGLSLFIEGYALGPMVGHSKSCSW
jgi:hypothetical protein